ncbi:MAG: hypothetical protein ROO76_12100 [Terriglobia bacterium]|nr:hypothetical protein [Terriglobia bacterium]
MKLQKHVLRDFLSEVAVCEEVEREGEHHRLVLANQISEILSGIPHLSRLAISLRNCPSLTYTPENERENAKE